MKDSSTTLLALCSLFLFWSTKNPILWSSSLYPWLFAYLFHWLVSDFLSVQTSKCKDQYLYLTIGQNFSIEDKFNSKRTILIRLLKSVSQLRVFIRWWDIQCNVDFGSHILLEATFSVYKKWLSWVLWLHSW